MQELDYAEMLEIPVSTVTVTKKKSFFRRKEQPPRDDIKERVVDSVNERVNERAGSYVEAEDLSDPPPPVKKPIINFSKDRESIILFSEIAAVCAIAIAIFLTNIFMPTSAINTFLSFISGNPQEIAEPTYSDFMLSSVVSAFSDADVMISDDGVLSFIGETGVYPICDGKIATVSQQNGAYVVEIAHTSTFSSVITGLTDVYSAMGTAVFGNIPFAYSDGQREVNISLYNNGKLLNCLTLAGEVPVWNS